MTTTATECIIVSFDNRKRAKDATKSIEALDVESDCDVKVYVHDRPKVYVIECRYPLYLDGEIKGIMALGRKIVTEYGPAYHDDDVVEFYQGEGLSRFRGN